jgi:hypothetical protein
MKPFATEHTDKCTLSIRTLLLIRGIGGTLDYFCTFSAFSVLSSA